MSDKTEFARKSDRYRASHLAMTKFLYGDATEIPKITPRKPKAARKRQVSIEWQHQVSLVTWARNLGILLISIPNHGKRSYWTGQKEVAAGLTKGVSDLFLAMPNKDHHGYWIELKRPGGRPTAEQYDWAYHVRAHGYKWAWFEDWGLARESIIEYLGL